MCQDGRTRCQTRMRTQWCVCSAGPFLVRPLVTVFNQQLAWESITNFFFKQNDFSRLVLYTIHCIQGGILIDRQVEDRTVRSGPRACNRCHVTLCYLPHAEKDNSAKNLRCLAVVMGMTKAMGVNPKRKSGVEALRRLVIALQTLRQLLQPTWRQLYWFVLSLGSCQRG